MKKMKKGALALGIAFTVILAGCGPVPVSGPGTLSSDVPGSEIRSEEPSETLDSDWTAPEPDKSTEIEKELAVAAEPEYEYDFDAHHPNEWQSAYKEFLDDKADDVEEEDEDEDDLPAESYFLANVDDTYGDYIPELCIRTGTCEADYQLVIYAYDEKKGEVVNLVPEGEIYAGHSQFTVGPNGNLYSYGGHMGYLTVTEYSDLSGKVKSEVVMEKDINKELEDADYPSLKEVFGEDIEFCTEVAIDNPAPLLWYLNIPVATGDITDSDKMADFFDYVMDDKNKKEVYVVAYERYCSCETGVMTLKWLLDGGMDTYEKDSYLFAEYVDADMNEDGQIERLVKIVNNRGNYSYILLSYQDGIFYAYAFPYFEMKGELEVVNFSVYHNWYSAEINDFYGFVFDKDRCMFMYSDCPDKESADAAMANAKQWAKY